MVELEKLGGQNIKIRPLFGKFLALKMKGHLEPVLKNTLFYNAELHFLECYSLSKTSPKNHF
jgi:hypothetical protein